MKPKPKPGLVLARAVMAMAILLPILGAIAWRLALPARASLGAAEITWRTLDHSPGLVVVSVRGPDGEPAANLRITSESSSGTDPWHITDAAGVGSWRPGEGEVLAVWVGDRRFPLRPTGWRSDFFAPECTSGIVFEVRLRTALK